MRASGGLDPCGSFLRLGLKEGSVAFNRRLSSTRRETTQALFKTSGAVLAAQDPAPLSRIGFSSLTLFHGAWPHRLLLLYGLGVHVWYVDRGFPFTDDMIVFVTYIIIICEMILCEIIIIPRWGMPPLGPLCGYSPSGGSLRGPEDSLQCGAENPPSLCEDTQKEESRFRSQNCQNCQPVPCLL